MGTRSTIAIQNPDGTITGVYCHWDGYVDHNGRILHKNYDTEDKVLALIELGNISQLCVTTDSTIAYARDRGEYDQAAESSASWSTFIKDHGEEYNYIFVVGEGWYVDSMNTIAPLSRLLEKEVA